jgi:hypothetical protein
MGWTGSAQPAAKLIADEVSSCTIVRKAWGPTEDGQRECWLHLRAADGDEFLAVALVTSDKRSGETWNYVKIVTESMGPNGLNVPDRIWNKRPELPAYGGDPEFDYARQWRERVETYRATFPLNVADLTIDDVDRLVCLPGHLEGRFRGWVKTSKTVETPTFDFGEGRRRIANWRSTRCSKSTTKVTA